MTYDLVRRGSRALLVAGVVAMVSCGGGGGTSTPTQPTAPTARASISILSFAVTGTVSGTEYSYRFPAFGLQNTGNAAATIASVSFRFTRPGASAGVATFTPSELFGSATVASGASTSRVNVTVTDTTDRPFATSVEVTVTYSDSVGTSTAVQSADVPPLPSQPPPAVTFSLSGTAVEGSAGVSGVRVEVTTGADAGAAVLTDGSGQFSFGSLQPGTFTLLASKSGYANQQQTVALSGNRAGLKLDLTKTSTPPPAPPSLCAPASASCGTATARCNDGTLSCSQNRSGTCSSHSGVSCFICPGLLCNGIAPQAVSWTPVPVAYTPVTRALERE